MREHTKEGERNDKTLEQIVSFDLPPVSSVIATVSHRTTTRHAWCFLKRSLELLSSRERGERKDRDVEKFLQECRIQRGTAALKNPLESARGKGERAGGAPAAIGHSAIFAGIHASVSRAVFIGKASSPSPLLYVCISARISPSKNREAGSSRRSLRYTRERSSRSCWYLPSVHSPRGPLSSRYLPPSLNLHFIYGCASRFIVVRAALFALTCFNVVRSFLSRVRLHRLMLYPFSSPFLSPFSVPSGTSYFYAITRYVRK